jgi:hypothetical protein
MAQTSTSKHWNTHNPPKVTESIRTQFYGGVAHSSMFLFKIILRKRESLSRTGKTF